MSGDGRTAGIGRQPALTMLRRALVQHAAPPAGHPRRFFPTLPKVQAAYEGGAQLKPSTRPGQSAPATVPCSGRPLSRYLIGSRSAAPDQPGIWHANPPSSLPRSAPVALGYELDGRTRRSQSQRLRSPKCVRDQARAVCDIQPGPSPEDRQTEGPPYIATPEIAPLAADADDRRQSWPE
jgi:hypothetical protein